jgi:hypothetical protein
MKKQYLNSVLLFWLRFGVIILGLFPKWLLKGPSLFKSGKDYTDGVFISQK